MELERLTDAEVRNFGKLYTLYGVTVPSRVYKLAYKF